MEAGAGATWPTIAAFVSAGAAAAAAVFAGLALYSQTRAIDVSSYLRILECLQDFERRLKVAASDRDENVFALREFVNFLDAISHLHNARRFGRGTAALCWDALCNSIAALEINKEALNIIEESITGRETFKHLADFREKHRSEIEERKAIFRALERHDA